MERTDAENGRDEENTRESRGKMHFWTGFRCPTRSQPVDTPTATATDQYEYADAGQ